MPCHRFHLSWCRNTKDVKILTDIAKILINSEKPTPFGGIFSKTGRFDHDFPLPQSGIIRGRFGFCSRRAGRLRFHRPFRLIRRLMPSCLAEGGLPQGKTPPFASQNLPFRKSRFRCPPRLRWPGRVFRLPAGIQWPIWDEKNVRNADREALRTGNRRTSGFRRTVRVGASPEQNTDRTDAVGTRSIGFTINSLHPTMAIAEITLVVGGSRLKDLGTLAGHAFGTHDPA